MSGAVNCDGAQVGERNFTPGQIGTTTAFNPALSDILIEMFERCQIRAVELQTEHFQSARRSLNLVQSRWSNRGINLWKVQLYSVPLTHGQIDVPIDPSVINVLDVYRTTQDQSGFPTDIILYPLDRSGYAAIPNKTQQGPPTSFWFQRLQSPNMKLWPAVDAQGPYTLNYYTWRQMADAIPQLGLTGDMVERFYEAYVAECAAHIAMKWAPDRMQVLATYAVAAYTEAQMEDHEKIETHIVPDFSSYYMG